MKFWMNLIAFTLVFFGTYTLITYLMNGCSISSSQLESAICYTVGAAIGYGLVTFFQEKKKKKENN